MAETTKQRIGTMPCEGSRCKSHDRKIPVVVFKNDRGTLSYRCDYCDRAPYARQGTEQHADWMQDIKLFQINPPEDESGKSATPVAATAAPATVGKGVAPAPAAKKESSTLFG